MRDVCIHVYIGTNSTATFKAKMCYFYGNNLHSYHLEIIRYCDFRHVILDRVWQLLLDLTNSWKKIIWGQNGQHMITLKKETLKKVVHIISLYVPHFLETEACSVGHHSDNGIVPCFKCLIGEYQPQLGQTSCQACPNGTTTQDFGSQSLDLCLGMYRV